jgi:uncharacterized SAM-binding protein YcdF (DUF218 family)
MTRKRLVVLLLVVLALGFGTVAFVNAARFLDAPGREPGRADAVMVLGGGFGDRERRAAEIYRAGLAPTLVLMGMEDSVNDKEIDYLHWRSRVLSRAGVPESAMLIDPESSTSLREARYGARLARERGWKRVIVVSDPPHMRRLAIVWGRAFEGSGTEVVLVPTRPSWWTPDQWWSNDKCAGFVVMEYIKLVHTLI